MARPPDDAEGPRTKRLTFRVTPGQLERWAATAAEADEELADWVRTVLDTEAARTMTRGRKAR